MAGHYNATCDPRLQSDDSDRDGIEEIARKRPRTESSAVGAEVQVVGMAPSERTLSVGPDDTVALQDKIKKLETHSSLMHQHHAKLTEDNAAMAKERNYYHKRFKEVTTQHADMVRSHVKRVEEKHKVLKDNSVLLQENATLVKENAAHIENDIQNNRTINELEEEIDKLRSVREENKLELKRLRSERNDLENRVNALLADVRTENRDARKALERGRSRGPGVEGRERARSSFRGDDASDMRRGGGGDNDRARSRYRGPEREHDRAGDGRKQIGGHSYQPPPPRDGSRPAKTRACFPSGKQPPTGPMGDRRR